jgi:hypothetical protein
VDIKWGNEMGLFMIEVFDATKGMSADDLAGLIKLLQQDLDNILLQSKPPRKLHETD